MMDEQVEKIYPAQPEEEAGDERLMQQRHEIGLTLGALRWLELQGLRMDHGKLRERGDAWWLAEGEEVSGPVGFGQILNRLVEGRGPVQFAVASVEDAEPVWHDADYRPIWLRPIPARCWSLGFWLVLLVLGHGTVELIFPHSLQGILLPVYWLGAAGWIGWMGWRLRARTARKLP